LRPTIKLEVWAFDEHRLGLKPVARHVWLPIGSRAVAVMHPRYQWLYVQAFVRPTTGESVYWLTTTVDTQTLSAVLADFAKERELGEKRWAIVVVDQAGWHVSTELVIPEGLVLAFLPSYSPQLQPAERLWPLVDAGVANGWVTSLSTLWERVGEQCAYLRSRLDLVRAHSLFHWWPVFPA
jgi:transposase